MIGWIGRNNVVWYLLHALSYISSHSIQVEFVLDIVNVMYASALWNVSLKSKSMLWICNYEVAGYSVYLWELLFFLMNMKYDDDDDDNDLFLI